MVVHESYLSLSWLHSHVWSIFEWSFYQRYIISLLGRHCVVSTSFLGDYPLTIHYSPIGPHRINLSYKFRDNLLSAYCYTCLLMDHIASRDNPTIPLSCSGVNNFSPSYMFAQSRWNFMKISWWLDNLIRYSATDQVVIWSLLIGLLSEVIVLLKHYQASVVMIV
jgi:hypothetical protein